MKTEIEILSEKLYNFLLVNGVTHEDNCTNFLFPPVVFDKDHKKEYFEYLTKKYGYSHRYQINCQEFETEAIPYKDSYIHKTSLAYQYLRKQGKAGENNNGFNDYSFYAIAAKG